MLSLIDYCNPCWTEPEWQVDICHCSSCEGYFLERPLREQITEAIRETIERYVTRLAPGEHMEPVWVMPDDRQPPRPETLFLRPNQPDEGVVDWGIDSIPADWVLNSDDDWDEPTADDFEERFGFRPFPKPTPWPQGNPNRIPSIDWSGPSDEPTGYGFKDDEPF